MKKPSIHHLSLPAFQTESGASYSDWVLSYQVFGPPLGSAPVVLVVHALTGNSNVSGPSGWWRSLIGPEKVIDTQNFSVLAFNIPGNGYANQPIPAYKDFNARDIARIFGLALSQLGVSHLFAALGGSLGGGIVWELAALHPQLIDNVIPIATDWQSKDWLVATTFVQDSILNHSSHPVRDARLHAMLCYRSPQSLNGRFRGKRNREPDTFQVETWLEYHGQALETRFRKDAYLLMNHLLGRIDILRGRESLEAVIAPITGNIHLISVDSDLLFPHADTQATYAALQSFKQHVFHYTIVSEHGHDAFLMEYDQLERILSPLFQPQLVPSK